MRRKTTGEFIEKARKIHGDKYDYSKVDYVGYKGKVKIFCRKHGVFEQTASDHLSACGCPECSKEYLSERFSHNTDKFIQKAKLKHGDRYGYSKVNYKKDGIKVIIECFEHGFFEQTPSNHLRGQGCYKCGILKTIRRMVKTTEQFIIEAIEIHGDKYKYDKVNYIKNNIKVEIKCNVHGYFYQTPSDHLSGKDCRKCGNEKIRKKQQKTPAGWNITNWDNAAKKSKHFDRFKVYIIRCWNNEEEFYKIGRTFLKTSRRFYSKKGMPYKYEILNEIIFDNAKDAFDKENCLKRENKENKYIPLIPFGGRYECFSKLNDYKY